MYRLFNSRYQMPRFAPDGEDGGDGGTGDGAPDGSKPKDPLEGLNDEQRKAIERRIAAARKDGEKTGQTKAETALEEAKRLAKEDTDRQKLIDEGKFKEVEEALKGNLTSVSGEKDALAQQVADYDEVLSPMVNDLRTELAEAIGKDAIDDEPQDLTPLKALKWLQDRKKLVEKLGGGKPAFQRTPTAPRPITATREQAVEAEQKKLRENPNYQRF